MLAGLNIAALAHRTGVAPDTLRKWEQRYSILRPTRTAGGQRRYSERDVARVEWLSERLREGYRIGEAATLLGAAGSTGDPARSPAELVRGILDALEHGDAADIGVHLDQAFALNSVEATLAKPLDARHVTLGIASLSTRRPRRLEDGIPLLPLAKRVGGDTSAMCESGDIEAGVHVFG